MIQFSTSHPASDLSAIALIEKPAGVIGWNGPYLSFEKHSTNDYLVNNEDIIAITFSPAEAFSSTTTCHRSSNDCSVYTLYLSTVLHNDNFEEKIDGNSTAGKDGNFRIFWGHQYFKSSMPFDKSTSPNA